MYIRNPRRTQLHTSRRLSEQNKIKFSVEHLMLLDSVGKTRYAVEGVHRNGLILVINLRNEVFNKDRYFLSIYMPKTYT
jgi:hypothetical protein